MGYKTLATMNIAIIGTGKMVEALAEGLALAGHEIYLATKNEDEKLNDFLFDEFENIHLHTIEDAAYASDVVIIATPAGDVREVAYLLDDVRKKVIIDASIIPQEKTREYFHSVNAIKAITSSPYVIRCFNCTDYNNLFEATLNGDVIDMFVAGESKKAKALARSLCKDLNFTDCYDFGDNNSIQLLEDMARFWQNFVCNQKRGSKLAIRLLKK